jgi:hypothetical protein
VVDKLQGVYALGADITFTGRAVGVSGDALGSAVGIQVYQYLADAVAASAGGTDNRCFGHGRSPPLVSVFKAEADDIFSIRLIQFY